METHSAAGTPISVRRMGRGTPIVCLHAIGHDSRDFEGVAEQLGDRFELIAVDWPGHGDSPAEETPASADRYTDIFTELVDVMGLKDFALLANSVGGGVALRYAAANPQRVTALVQCNPAGYNAVNFVVTLFCKSKARMFACGEKGDPSYPAKFRKYYEKQVLTEPASFERREQIIAGASKCARQLREGWTSFASKDADKRHLAQHISCPTLYAWGRKDKIISYARSKKVVAMTPRQRTVLFDCTHTAFLERPDEFCRELSAFLETAS